MKIEIFLDFLYAYLTIDLMQKSNHKNSKWVRSEGETKCDNSFLGNLVVEKKTLLQNNQLLNFIVAYLL